MANLTKNLIGGLLIATSLLRIGTNELDKFTINKSPEIKNLSELDEIVKSEKKKFGIEEKAISVSFNSYAKKTSSRKLETGINCYQISLCNNQRTISALKHELYHIAKGDCDKGYEFILKNKEKNLFRIEPLGFYLIWEPRAAIYGAAGIRL